MIVCSCYGITDREVREAYGRDAGHECRAGRGCGNCTGTVEDIVARLQRPRRPEQTGADAAGSTLQPPPRTV